MMNAENLLKNLRGMLQENQINTNPDDLYDAAADRYKKYAKARKVLDVPSPIAIVYPNSAEEVSRLLVFCNKNQVNVIPRGGKTATGNGAGRRSIAGAGRRTEKKRVYDRSFAAIKAGCETWRSCRHKKYRSVFHIIRWN